MSEIRWGRVALLVPVAVALLPVALVLAPVAILAVGLHAILAQDWWPHPGELIACVIAPIVYAVGMIALAAWLTTGEGRAEAWWTLFASVVLGATSTLWAANDHRKRGTLR